VGAAMMMRVQTRFTIFGYPGFAMICFIAAAVMGLLLIYTIVHNDVKSRKPPSG
jgi:hypothetical protein